MVTGTGLVERAGELRELARRRAGDAEEQRRLAPDVVAGVLESGFARHFVPVRFGGVKGGFSEFARAVAVVAEGCAAAAWCASVASSLARVAAFLPSEGQVDIWGGGADAYVVGSLSPLGKAVPAPGGWRVSGSWAYISGVDYSDWVVVCAVLPGGGGARLFALPRGAYAVKDTWTGSGMRGTGSNTVVVDDVFVPESRSVDRQRLTDGAAAPIQAVNGLSCAPAALGAARGALGVWTADTARRLARGGGKTGGPGPALSTYEAVLARSSGEIDAAALLLERAAHAADRGVRITEAEIARNVRDYALSAELLVAAVNRMYAASGTSGQSTGSPLERAWRDVNSIATHIALAFDPAAVLFASRPFALEAA
ncbi:acyl-CoA dehydrogenase family protein [Streptomyces sp. NPDC001903]|uniref:acyl-CoA dehydrogenase family protein n=1 Tax=Streptomyces sp. NPDC001903 TaxID=3364622 RepID=UPI0036B4814E